MPAGNSDVDVFAVRQVQALRRPIGGIRQRHRHFGLHVGADAEIFRLEVRSGTAARAAAESVLQDVLEAAKSAAATGSGAAAPGGAGETLRTEVEVFEIGIGSETGAGARPWPAATEAAAGKALEARLALGVDLAAIERLALVFVGKQLIGGIQLGKTRRRFRIVLVGVGMQFFGELAIGAFDVARARLPIDAQDLIGITHPCRTPSRLWGWPRLPTWFPITTMWE